MRRIESLVINIGDKCNMECSHCLRGDRPGKDFDLALLPKIFKGIDEVGCITISGGEPSCYPKIIEAITEYLVQREQRGLIQIYGMFIITNGKRYCQTLVDAVRTMLYLRIEQDYGAKYMVSGLKDIRRLAADLEEMAYSFGVAVSVDEFHEPISVMNYLKYKTSGVYSEVKEAEYPNGSIIARGWGAGIAGSYDRPYEEFHVETDGGDIQADTVYITTDGMVYGDCDMSYEMEEYNEPAGDLGEETLAAIMDRYAQNEQPEGEDLMEW